MGGEFEKMSFDLKKLNPSRGRPLMAKKKRRKWILLSGSFLIGFSLLTYFFVFLSSSPPPPTVPPEPVPSTVREPQLHTIEGDVKERSTLFKSLSGKNIPLRWIDLIISKLKPYVNFKKIKGGTYQFITDVEGQLVKFIFEASPTEIYEIEKDPQGYTAQKKKVPSRRGLRKWLGRFVPLSLRRWIGRRRRSVDDRFC